MTPADLVDLGGRAAVDQTLSRLAKAHTLRRLARGVYLYPQQHPALGDLQPSAETIAKALGRPRPHTSSAGGSIRGQRCWGSPSKCPRRRCS